MKIALQVLLMLCILVVGSAGRASPHEIHDLQRDLAALKAEQQQATEKAALAQKLELKTALESVDGRLDQLSTRVDAVTKRIDDLFQYATWTLALFALLAGAIYIGSDRRAEKTTLDWLNKGDGQRAIDKALDSRVDSLRTQLSGQLKEEVAAEIKAHEDDKDKKQGQLPMSGSSVVAPTQAAIAAASRPDAPVPVDTPSSPAVAEYDSARAAALAAFNANRFDAAFEAASLALQQATTDFQKLQAQRSRAATLFRLDRLGEALADFSAVAIEFPSDAAPATTVEIAKGHLGKALTLYKLNRESDAEAILEALVASFPQVNEGALGEVVAQALAALAYEQHDAGRHQEAIDTVRGLRERFAGAQESVEIKRSFAQAELTLGLAMGETEGPEAERQTYLQLRQRFQHEDDVEIKETVSYALFNTGLAYEKLGQKEAAREVYLQIERDYLGETSPALVTTVRDARGRLRALDPPPERPAAPASDR